LKYFDAIQKIDVPTAVTVGMYDGVHRGHRAVLEHLLYQADTRGLAALVTTFDPHPLVVVNPSAAPLLLYTPDERVQIVQSVGVDFLIQISFDRDIARLSADDFVEKVLLDTFSARTIVIGYDHGFGVSRSGNALHFQQLRKRFSFNLEIVPPVKFGDVTISSTQIRRSLVKGDVILANQMLGKYYSLRGKVIKGTGRGRELNCPTANLQVESVRKVVPRDGVYAVYVRIEGIWYKGLMNIGSKPTFGEKAQSLEVHLQNFEGNLYGMYIRVYFIARVREVKLFASSHELKCQIERDIEESKSVFARFPSPPPEWILE
jgi:riboflavin kinase/FMN adenylyltransferase